MSVAIFNGGTKLDDLASLANAAHKSCQQMARAMLLHAKDAGEVLLESKRLIPYGQFTSWVETNCDFSGVQARRYMTIARRWPELLAWSTRTRANDLEIDSLSIREAMRILSEKRAESSKHTKDPSSLFVDKLCSVCGRNLAQTSRQFVSTR